MIYCLNPECKQPVNVAGDSHCASCGLPLAALLRRRYRIQKQLGRGGFGKTFLAVDEDRLQAKCVIKQFSPQLKGTDAMEKAVRLFEQEAIRLDELGEHPQIPTLLAYFEQDQRLYLVQQFVEGKTLVQELAEEGAFDEKKIREVLSGILPILQFVHDHNVIHRDITPANIIRREIDNQLVLIDFGVAKLLTEHTFGLPGTKIGTEGYAPIEQLRNGKAYPASDLYSLGATCLYLLTRTKPEELYDPLRGRWLWRDNLAARQTSISDGIGQILDVLVRDLVAERFQDAPDALQALSVALKQPAVAQPVRRSPAPGMPPSLPNSQETIAQRTPVPPPNIALSSQPSKPVAQSRNVTQIDPPTGSARSQARTDNAATANPTAQSVSGDRRSGLSGINQPPTSRQHGSGQSATATPRSNQPQSRQISAKPPQSPPAPSPPPKSSQPKSGQPQSSQPISQPTTGIRTSPPLQPISHPVTVQPVSQAYSGSLGASVDKYPCLTNLKGHSSWVLALAVSPDARTVVSGGLDDRIIIWDLQSGQARLVINDAHSKPINSLAITPDGHQLVSGSDDDTLKVWQLSNGQLVRVITGHTRDVNAVTITPDGQFIVSGSEDRTVAVWRLATGERLRNFAGVKALIKATAMSVNGEYVAAGGSDNLIQVWNLNAGTLVQTLQGHLSSIQSLAVSAEGRFVVSGSKDRTIRIWIPKTGESVRTLVKHLDAVNAVAVTPDSRYIISGSADKTLRVWRLPTGELVSTLNQHTGAVNAIAISPNQRWFVSGGSDGQIYVWQLAANTGY
ncbi:protein kinase [filamentous cyanobacterium LEGE 11480]|uniref:Protein kinase n=1 Tax=Romeriopsis navalis LEGE 11480 TaxID=2777977 RepID=A0A928VQ76_9CYAN|nr:protein kinase [Romeriopsis navalis]MBE9030119.1 protein kinase [Romeriopsis navalis LEGE 11480]